ncbi:MAG: HAD family hydrolase [Oscillospiraceae bacterium]|nr:HAD family hydrolase [Oscillospiraceae bacterium]
MIRVHAGDRSFDAAAFVFDKDGLLFESRQFWIALSEERMRQIRRLGSERLVAEWADCFGVKTEDCVHVTDVDPTGILAVASPGEEITATAALIVQVLKLRWTEARDLANEIFLRADQELELRKALKPRPGFPGIMERLRRHGIPYGVATSDTTERALESFRLFDDPDALSFVVCPRDVKRGKPHPDMLEEVSRRLGIPRELLVMVGDSYVDVEMAKRAGSIGIGIPETGQMREQMQEMGAIVLETLDQIRFE